MVQDIHHQLYTLKSLNYYAKLMYVPSHVGITGNGIVDQFAESSILSFLTNFVSVKDIKNFFNHIELSNWQNITATKSQNKLFQRKKSIQSWKNLSHLNCSEEITITRPRTRHVKLTHNYLFQKAPKLHCQFCNTESINIFHIV